MSSMKSSSKKLKKNHGMGGVVLSTLKSSLMDRRQVQVKRCTSSSELSADDVVPHGSVLGYFSFSTPCRWF